MTDIIRTRTLMDNDDNNIVKIEDANVIYSRPWIEKYRPFKLSNIISQQEIITILQNIIKNKLLPHLLLHGPAGTGKTSTALALAIELFGPDNYKNRILELNASDERGIGVVRTKITNFAKLAVGYADPNYPSPPFKIIILDEVDTMTMEAQSALRKIMEEYSYITRFILICNYKNKIISPIQSRCTEFRFSALDTKSIKNRLTIIAKKEKLEFNSKVIKIIAENCDGDLRKAIMYLQNISYINNVRKIKYEDIYDMIGVASNTMVNKIDALLFNDKFDVSEIVQLAHHVNYSGIPITNILENIQKLTLKKDQIDDTKKADICIELSKTIKLLYDGGNEYLQLLNIIMKIKSIVLCMEDNNIGFS